MTTDLDPALCAAVENDAVYNYAHMVITTCDPTRSARRLAFDSASGELTVDDARKCVEFEGASGGVDGGPIIVWDCYGGDNQKWRRTAAGEIRSLFNDKCLDVPGGSTTVGTRLILFQCNGGANQRWTFAQSGSGSSDIAELPRAYVDTRYPAVSGRLLAVQEGGDLQAAIDSAQPGDQIVLASGASFTGNFRLRQKSGDDWIVIRGAATLPPQGTRMSPATASSLALPRVQTGNAASVLFAEAGAHHYWISGVELTAASNPPEIVDLVLLGSPYREDQSSAADVPHHLVIDRSYVHGQAGLNMRRCIGLHGAWSAVVDSHISECTYNGFQAQGIGGWNGPGPYRIVNNRIEASGIGVAFGGANVTIPGNVPADIEVRRNYVYKPLAWTNTGLNIIAHLETKNVRRILVEGNVFENVPEDGRGNNNDGSVFDFKSSNEDPGGTYSQDVTVRYNVSTNSIRGVLLSQIDPNPAPTGRIVIAHNILTGIAIGPQIRMSGRLANVTYRHNTFLGSGAVAALGSYEDVHPGCTFVDNVTYTAEYGILGTGTQEGTATLDRYWPQSLVTGNVLAGNLYPVPPYPAGNTRPGDIGYGALFVAPGSGNYRLQQFQGTASDRRDPGADVDAVERATDGVKAGITP